MTAATVDLRSFVGTVADFPKPGIGFRDLTPLLADSRAFAATIDALTEQTRAMTVDAVMAIEARGFLFGSPLAVALGVGFIPARKSGKLPGVTIGIDYTLEYGVDRLEVPAHALKPGARILVIDDLIATGGTAIACVELVRNSGAEVAGAAFVVDLPDLGGANRLRAMGVRVLPPLISFAETDRQPDPIYGDDGGGPRQRPGSGP